MLFRSRSGVCILKSFLAVGRNDHTRLGLRMAQFLNQKHINAGPMRGNSLSNTRYHATRPATSVAELPIGFNAYPDPTFYLNADPHTDSDPGSPTNADSSQKLDFDLKNFVCRI
jgi:hypothetical protein